LSAYSMIKSFLFQEN